MVSKMMAMSSQDTRGFHETTAASGHDEVGNHKTKVTKFWLPIRKFRTCISNEIQNGIGSLSPLENLIFSPKSNEKGGNWILEVSAC